MVKLRRKRSLTDVPGWSVQEVTDRLVGSFEDSVFGKTGCYTVYTNTSLVGNRLGACYKI